MENSKDHKAAAEPPLDCRVRGWQPMDTAPRTGVLIISDGENVSVGWWYNSSIGWTHWLPAGSKPTHWMPLPEAPNA